ncbi:Solute carrier family 22 member 21 [Amphibalanus amphitrite]|uniref:Solute carrier family 22 member 21 n=1 Tax=Amphibalanus amphitrite TaxID=1232801 RepID=A0A6A4VEV9_AMPAM|nr:Solute carrier family 22 member 21 [Amphibalanus amphitrite]
MVSCDELLSAAGDCGGYQRRLVGLFVLPVCFYIPVAYLTVLMQLSLPDHWCHVPGRPENVSLQQWWNSTLPRWVAAGGTAHCPDCLYGWEFDRSDFSETAPAAFLWVCDQFGQLTAIYSMHTVGNLLGSVVFGALSDRLGRRLLVFVVSALMPVFNIVAVLVRNPMGFTVMRVLSSLCYPVIYQLVFTLGMEFTGVSWRTTYAVGVSIAFTLGMCAIPLVAYLVNDWVYLGIATSLPALLIIPCLWVVDESPRWLVAQGRLSAASAVLSRVATANGLPPEPVTRLLRDADGPKAAPAHSPGLLALVRAAGPRLVKKAAAITVCWVTNVIMYYGLMLSFSDMSGSLFVNFFLLSVVELPSNLLALYVCGRFGRRPTQLVFFVLSAAAMFGIIPLKFVPGSGDAVTFLLMLGKFCTSLTFVVLYMQTAELYPTCVRSLGTGASSLVGIGAGAVSPYILQLAARHPTYPYAVFGAFGILGALSVSLLPETRGRPLPETMEDAEAY